MLILILLTVLLATLAFLGGGIFPGTLIITAHLLCLLSLYTSYRGKDNIPRTYLPTLITALILVLTLTAIPLPSAFTNTFNTQRASHNNLAENAIVEAIDIGLIKAFTPFFSISRNRSGTVRIILLLICAFTCGALTSQLEQKKKMVFIQLTLALAVLIAIAGFIGQWIIPQGKTIWWIFKVAHGSPVACFINRNHFGGFLAMLAPSALVLAITSYNKKRPAIGLLWGTAFVILSFIILSSLSRGAWLAWFFSTAATCIFLTGNTKSRKVIVVAICIALISIPIIFCTTSRTDVAERLASFKSITKTNSANMRFTTWKDSLRITKDYALLGTGANGFRMIFPQYRTSSSRKEFKHIENEYLQIPVETGIAGTLLILGIIISVFRLWRAGRDPESPAEYTIATCVFGALVATSIHASLDFAIRVPLYAITLSALIGLTLKSTQNQPAEPKGASLQPKFCYLAGIILVAIILLFGGINSSCMDSPDQIKQASPDKLCKILTYAPSSWQAWYHLGNASIESGRPKSYEFGERCITQAAEYDPLNYRLLEQLCRVRLYLKNDEGAKHAYHRLKKLRSWVTIKELEPVDEN